MKLKSPVIRIGWERNGDRSEGRERRRGSCSRVEFGKCVSKIENGVLRYEKDECRMCWESVCV